MHASVKEMGNHLVRVLMESELVLPTLLAVCGGYVICQWVLASMKKRELTKKRLKKREECKQALEKLRHSVQQLKIPNKEEILGLKLAELLQKLKSGELKPSTVLAVYQEQALLSHEKTNCLVEPIKEAMEQAEEMDGRSSRDLPLFGLPVSVKDNYGIKGYDSSVGYAKWIDRPFKEDAALITLLKKLGAIPFVKTNVPQTMISWETTNPIFGPTRNPYDGKRGVGGSSGGEGALVASGGSLLGFGSDIGGSIRIPANMNGVCGIKPSSSRVSSLGTHPTLRGQNVVKCCYGPLACDVDSLVISMKAIFGRGMWELDSTVTDMPFKDEVFNDKRKLRIGFYTDDGYFSAVPAMQRGVMMAKEALEKQGHEVVPWQFAGLGEKAARFWPAGIFGDDGALLKKTLEHDVTDSAAGNIVKFLRLPRWLRRMLVSFIKLMSPKMSVPLESILAIRSAGDWWRLAADVEDFRRDVISDWRRLGLDAVICPGFGCPACPLDMAALLPAAGSYTTVYSVLDFPAGSLPVTTVTEEDEESMANIPYFNFITNRTIKKAMVGSTGLPVNVQVVTLPFQDELCLRLMVDLEEALKTANVTPL